MLLANSYQQFQQGKQIRISTIALITIYSLLSFYKAAAYVTQLQPTPFPILETKNTHLQRSHVFILNNNRHAFNPFTSRNINKKLRWYDKDMTYFYDYVEAQPLLNKEQEQQYGKALKLWQYVQQAKKRIAKEKGNSFVTEENIAKTLECSVEALRRAIKLGEISQRKLLISNLRLVLAVVSRYRSASSSNLELAQIGISGLAMATERFDYSRGFRFSTYATWYVHQSIADYVRWKKHPAKMPGKYLVLLRKVKQYASDYKKVTGQIVTFQQLVKGLGATSEDVENVLEMGRYPALVSGMVRSENPKDERETTVEDLLLSTQDDEKAEEDAEDGFRQDLEMLMKTNLSELEKDVLRLRLGLDGEPMAVKNVGKKYRITWKEVKNLEDSAWAKLFEDEDLYKLFDRYQDVNLNPSDSKETSSHEI